MESESDAFLSLFVPNATLSVHTHIRHTVRSAIRKRLLYSSVSFRPFLRTVLLLPVQQEKKKLVKSPSSILRSLRIQYIYYSCTHPSLEPTQGQSTSSSSSFFYSHLMGSLTILEKCLPTTCFHSSPFVLPFYTAKANFCRFSAHFERKLSYLFPDCAR